MNIGEHYSIPFNKTVNEKTISAQLYIFVQILHNIQFIKFPRYSAIIQPTRKGND